MSNWLKILTIIALASMTPGVALSSVDGPIPSKSETLTLTSDFSGKWSVRWLSNDSRNPLMLTQNAINFTGNYINDAKDNCLVSGELELVSQLIKFQVKCPQWNIQMEGFPTLDGKTIVGEYLAYGKAVGGFIMSKE